MIILFLIELFLNYISYNYLSQFAIMIHYDNDFIIGTHCPRMDYKRHCHTRSRVRLIPARVPPPACMTLQVPTPGAGCGGWGGGATPQLGGRLRPL